MTVKELKELLELVNDQDVICTQDSRRNFRPAKGMYLLGGASGMRVCPGWDTGNLPRNFWLVPDLEEEEV